MDKERIQNAVREILIAVGEDPDREGLLETPKRVANMYEEIFAGLTEDPKQHIKLFNEQSNDEMVQVQERLTSDIADFLNDNLQPKGVAVIMEAEHMCMTMRGARAAGSKTQTSALRGIMRTDAKTRAEVLSLLK